MHSCITTLFLFTALFTTLSHSTSPPSKPSIHTTCIEPYTNYWHANHATIIVRHPTDPHHTLAILTRYKKFYPPTITAWLEEKRFHTVNASSLRPTQLCGWSPGEQVIRDSREHAFIYWKRSAMISATGISLNTSSADTKTPHHEVLATVRGVLLNNAPDADRYWAMTVMLGTACGTLLFALLFYVLAGYAALAKKKKKKKKKQRSCGSAEPVDVELQQIKLHTLSSAGMRRFEGPRTAGIARKSSVGVGVSEARKECVEPPPVYSVDGAGR